MTTVFIATLPEEIRNLLPWAVQTAAARGDDLTIALLQRRKGENRLTDISAEPSDGESELIVQTRACLSGLSIQSGTSQQNSPVRTVRLCQIVGEDRSAGVNTHMTELNPGLIIAPAPAISKDHVVADDWQTELLNLVDCDVMLMRDDSTGVERPVRPAVFITDGPDDEAALKYALQLNEVTGGHTTAVYVQPSVSDEAESVGRRHLEHVLPRLVRSAQRDSVRQRVIVAGSTADAFRDLNAGDFDILIMGTRDLRKMRRFLHTGLTAKNADTQSAPAIAVLKCGASLGHRLRNKADQVLQKMVPQLSREERVNLVSRVQESSNWDFDFVFLVSLATLIACLGLAENSGAVIVGAMLVAPLMTPIAGVGLGVAHANAWLTNVAFRTALRGFITALVIGIVFGWCVQAGHRIGWLEALRVSGPEAAPDHWVYPSEMENRTRPQFYDLLIALASGVAAAYAMGRPNLFSALPGVAIAAALVPPIATSGIAYSHGHLVKGTGALLLFLTNMVTIILGTSLVFRAVGIRSQKEGPNAARWPRHVLLLLVLLSVLITLVIELNNRR